MMDRRAFIGAMGAAALVPAGVTGFERLLAQEARRNALGRTQTLSPDGITLTARRARVDVGAGQVEAFTVNGGLPSPTLRIRQGERARMQLVNELPEPTILHWHGLAVPQEADGHPRLAIAPGETYDYDFPILNRAGTYWYHPHPHHRTAAQSYLGMGGFLIIDDDDEDGYELPSGDYELPLLLQDKRISGAPALTYDVSMRHDMVHGYLGNTGFTNGIADATVDVSRTRYRLRIANGSNARILDLGLSNGAPMTLIGSDGGLVAAPTTVERVMLAPAERADVVVDFSAFQPGERVMLRSYAFQVPGMMGMGMMAGGGRGGRGGGRGGRGGMPAGGMMMGGDMPMQGTEMDFLEFVVQDSRPESGRPLPTSFAPVPDRGELTGDIPRKTFTFSSSMMGPGSPQHSINGLQFEMLRVDARIQRMQSEVWTFVNDGEVPHPVHAHAGQFRPLSRTGGRGRLMPWETGLKDTILIMPGESVDVMARFFYAGLYLLHCHNLEHEDMDMMINFEVTE